MVKYPTIKFIFKFVFLAVLILSFANILFAEEKYEPYPVIFVHGYNNMPERISYDELWKEVFSEFEKYFVDENGENKYFRDYSEYCYKFDYRVESNGNLNARVPELKNVIDEVLKKTGQEKVIIVAHSAGGLIIKRLLADYPAYQQKIEKVVFIGTPHQQFGVRFAWSSEFGEKVAA